MMPFTRKEHLLRDDLLDLLKDVLGYLKDNPDEVMLAEAIELVELAIKKLKRGR